jgi:hypothetical protein
MDARGRMAHGDTHCTHTHVRERARAVLLVADFRIAHCAPWDDVGCGKKLQQQLALALAATSSSNSSNSNSHSHSHSHSPDAPPLPFFFALRASSFFAVLGSRSRGSRLFVVRGSRVVAFAFALVFGYFGLVDAGRVCCWL